MAKKSLEKEHKPIYIITGKDTSLVNARCEKLLDEILPHEERAMGLLNADPDQITAAEVFDELRTLPFLADKRVVLIKNADSFISQSRELFEKYFKNPCSSSILIMTTSSWAGNTKLAKALPKVGELIKTEPLKSWQLPDELVKYAKVDCKKTLSKSSAQMLVELLGDDICVLYNEVDKLALLAGDEKAITSQHIESLTARNRVFNVFGVFDAALSGQSAKAISRLRKMFDSDKSAEYTAVGAFHYQLAKMFNAKAMLGEGQNPMQVASKLRVFGQQKENFFRIINKLSQRQLGNLIEKLAYTDLEIKTGQTTAKAAIERLVLKLSYTQAKVSAGR